MPLVPLTVMVSALLGWSDIEIQPSSGERAAASYRSVATLDRPTERTVETLKRYSLEREYRRDVNKALLHIEKSAQQRAEPELVYALAELSWIEGKRLETMAQAAGHSTATSTPPPMPSTSSSTPIRCWPRGASRPTRGYRQAMELYNAGARPPHPRGDDPEGDIRTENGQVISFKFHGSERKIRFVLQDSPWRAGDVHKLLLATDFEVSGLNPDS